jgi:hypothetical protein
MTAPVEMPPHLICREPLFKDLWMPVPWAPAYEVSYDGQVRSSVLKKPYKRPRLVTLRPYLDKDGYGYLTIDGQKWRVHRLVYRCFIGELVEGLVVCHRDGNKLNNSVPNLLQTTQIENIGHKLYHGTHQTGERHWTARRNAA